MPICSRCRRRFPHDDCHVCGRKKCNELAYNEGLAAAKAGAERIENPYSLRMAPECHDSWDEGWMNWTEEEEA